MSHPPRYPAADASIQELIDWGYETCDQLVASAPAEDVAAFDDADGDRGRGHCALRPSR